MASRGERDERGNDSNRQMEGLWPSGLRAHPIPPTETTASASAPQLDHWGRRLVIDPFEESELETLELVCFSESPSAFSLAKIS
ncbi:hypothetical protein AAG906_031847 [Vitis piasezkii]